ncbi:MAG: Histidine--tRNA ligase [Parcubacteria group bacterium ADurb.Bin192]|nr:MAG: Histidine--tRNA ligase [Parcubacteria group bacterium ADurb.Bin192]
MSFEVERIMSVKPTLPAGVRDYLPAEMLFREQILAKIRAMYEVFGFSPIETPAIEREEVLTGGKPPDMIIWRTATSTKHEGDDGLAMHYDLTVPLARVVAAHSNSLPRPFRRYQCQKVWRGEKPQAGRYREFMQFDADIVGSDSLLADTEIIWLMVSAMRTIGFERFKVRFSTRKVLNALAELVKVEPGSSLARDLFRILDKQDKIGRDGVAALLAKQFVAEEDRDPNDPDATESGLGFSEEQIKTVSSFLDITGSSAEIVEQLQQLFAGRSTLGEQAAADLRIICEGLTGFGVPAENWIVDISVARGLAYYTGPVFETTLLDLPEIGSVMSGGRYDDLVTRFTGESVPATGASIGVDRLFAAMEKLGLVEKRKTKTQVLVTIMDQSLTANCLEALRVLREAGIPSEVYMGPDMALKAQMAYALNQGIKFVIFVGQSEAEAGTVQLKDTSTRQQEQVTLPLLAQTVKSKAE